MWLSASFVVHRRSSSNWIALEAFQPNACVCTVQINRLKMCGLGSESLIRIDQNLGALKPNLFSLEQNKAWERLKLSGLGNSIAVFETRVRIPNLSELSGPFISYKVRWRIMLVGCEWMQYLVLYSIPRNCVWTNYLNLTSAYWTLLVFQHWSV